MNTGWIAIPRDLTKHWLWRSPRRLRMWMEMVFKANWRDGFTVSGTKRVPLRRGQFATNMRELSRELGCTKQTLLTFLELLEEEGMISRECPGNKFTIITINDYDTYSPRMNDAHPEKDAVEGSTVAGVDAESGPATPDSGEEAENAVETPESDGSGIHKLDRKLDHIRINKKNNNISSSSLAREKNLKIFEKIDNDKYFWIDTATGLGMDPESPPVIRELRARGKMFLGERLSKGKKLYDEEEMRNHLFNFLRKGNEKKIEENRLQEQNKTDKNNNNNGNTEIDSRRGVDAPAAAGDGIPKGRF